MRQINQNVADTVCHFCWQEEEDIIHFLGSCPEFKTIRDEYRQEITTQLEDAAVHEVAQLDDPYELTRFTLLGDESIKSSLMESIGSASLTEFHSYAQRKEYEIDSVAQTLHRSKVIMFFASVVSSKR